MNASLMFSSEGDLWRTPANFLTWLRTRFDFTLDAAASDGTVAQRFINAEQDALVTPWNGRTFCNPPYSMGAEFVARGVSLFRENPLCEGVCFLVPVRTDTDWWQEAWPTWNRVEFLKGRIKFWLTPAELDVINASRAEKGKKPISAVNTAPFPSALLIAGFGLEGRAVECVDWPGRLKPRRTKLRKAA